MKWVLRKTILVLFWGVVFICSLGTIFALGFGKVLPYLDNYRPQIESNLQQIIGYPVSIEGIDGRLEGIDPSLSISQFSLFVNGETALKIDEMRIRIDLVQSILTLSPQFSYLRFSGSHISLQEDAGTVRLKGAAPTSTVKNDVGIERVLGYLSDLRNVSILNTKLDLNSNAFGDHVFNSSEIYVVQEKNETLFKSEFYVNKGDVPFLLNARLESAVSLFGEVRLKASIKAPAFTLPVDRLVAENGLPITSIQAGGDIWLDAIIGKQLELRSESNAIKLTFNDDRHYELSSSIKLRYTHKQPSIRIELNDFSVKHANVTYDGTNIHADWTSITNRSRIRFDQVDLGLVKQLGSYFIPVHYQAKGLVDGLSPTGKALNGEVSLFRKDDKLSFSYVSNLQSASVDAYQGIPAVKGINATFRLSEEEGSIDFLGKNTEIFFDSVYRNSWLTDSASGRVHWQQDGDVVITGQDLNIQRDSSSIVGGFRLEVRENASDWISLDLRGEDIPITDRLTYLPPNALDSELENWIQEAFTGQGQADFIDVFVQSELSDNARPDVKVKLAASNVDIMFDEQWPTAHNVKGTFEYDKDAVRVQIDSAVLEELEVANISLTAPIIDNAVDWLYLEGAIEDDSNVILAFLKETPLKDTVLTPFVDWEIQGIIKGKMQIGIPFSEGDAKVDVALNFKNNPLLMKDLELESFIQEGQVHYSSEDGLTDTTFEVESFGGESNLKLRSAFTENDDLIIYGELSGTANIQDAGIWLETPNLILNKVSGVTPYTGRLSINDTQDGQFDLTINSDLVGIEARLPEPIGKSEKETTALQVKVKVHESDLLVDTKLEHLLQSRFLYKDSLFVGGEAIINAHAELLDVHESNAQKHNVHEELSLKIPQGLVVKGSMSDLDIEAWHTTFYGSDTEYATESGTDDPIDAPTASYVIPNWLNEVDLIIDTFVINKDNSWHNLKASYQAEKNNGFFVSADEGNFRVITESDTPEIHFGYLSWATDTSEELDNVSLEAPISAYQVPNMKLSVEELYVDQQPYGDWQATVSRAGSKIIASPITSTLNTGELIGSFIWDDRGDESRVQFEVVAKGKDLKELTGKFSDKAFVSSENYNINVDLGWQGHPFDFDRESLSGNINFNAEEGNFHQIEEMPAFLKALGIFNVGALSRRLTLDFSDLYEPGLTYDTFSGNLNLKSGILKTVSPISIISPSAELTLAGEANIVEEILDERLTATFPLSGTLPLAGLLLGSPQIAGILFLTDQLIGDEISKVTSISYSIKGPFDEPVIAPVKFDPSEKKDD